jgi:hypothetical protein
LTWGFGGTTTLTVEPDALVMIAVADDRKRSTTSRTSPAGTWSASGRRTGLVVTWQ